MNILRRIKNSLRKRGIKTTFFKVYILIADYWFDIKYGTDTTRFLLLTDLTVTGGNKERGGKYQPTRIVPLRGFLTRIKPVIPLDSVLLDLGCGKGRVLMIASEFDFREARGIEFAHELCNIARSNCAAYKRAKGTRTNFEIIESDVVDYVIKSHENVFFLFNPFDEVVLSRTLANIVRSLEVAPRKVLIIFYNPRFNHVIEQQRCFSRVFDQYFWGYHFVVYSNTG